MSEHLDGRLFGEGQPCFGCAPDHPFGLRLRFRRDGDTIRTRWMPSEPYQGPPGIVHGGLVMALADEVAAWTLIGALERFGFTTQVEGKLRRAVRIGSEVEGEGHILERGRLTTVAVRITQADALCFAGSFRFAMLGREAAERLLGGPLPDAWARFAG